MIWRTLLAGALLAAGLAGSAASSSAGAAPAQASGACTTADGVTVIVSFNGLNGRQTETRCASSRPSSGFNALAQAGLSTTQPSRMPGFVCRIDGLPATDPCINTPPANAYWAYWAAPRGGSWCYSKLGPGNRTPPPGTVEGWSFVQGSSGANPPAISPPPPIPGVAPTALPGSHCTATPAPTPPPTTAPRPPTTVPPAPTAPAPTNPTAPAPGGGGSGSGGSIGGGGSAGGSSQDAGGSAGDPQGSDGTDGDTGNSDGGKGADGEKPGDTDANGTDTDPADDEDSDESDEAGSADSDADSDTEDEAAELDAWEERAEAAAGGGPVAGADVSDRSGGGSPWALIVVGAVVGVLAVGGYLRNRRTWTA